jgi:tRNA (5-methylaminomethyl-2-thiouridylate)-methyltransferase
MKTAVLLSGGVDSSVALGLLKAQGGHELTAFYLKIWLEDELAFLGDCPWETDLQYARAVCQQLDLPLRIVPLQSEYLAQVVDHALRELRAGRTPSPDIFCNQRIKFGEFFKRIGPEFTQVASGHYARISQDNGAYLLQRAPDPVKDQTYFLSNLNQAQLSRALFPIGHLQKYAVRRLACDMDLPTQARKDSQGICFLGKINYRDFVQAHLGQQDGPILEQNSDRELGRHQGFWFYTIGQRHGLRLGGGPWYVVAKDTQRNIVYVSHKDHEEQRLNHQFTATQLNWIAGPPIANAKLQVKLRHGPDHIDCCIQPADSGNFQVDLSRPDPGIAPGQHAVFYHGETCLGGGIIEL